VLDQEFAESTTANICDQFAHVKGALLPILNKVQEQFGYVPKEVVSVIAQKQNLSRAEVHGVISFYHLYRDKPGGKHTVYVCCAEACQSMGARDLMQHASEHLDTAPHETSSDGQFNLEPIYCLGNCACAPAIMIDEELHARVSKEKFNTLISEAGKS